MNIQEFLSVAVPPEEDAPGWLEGTHGGRSPNHRCPSKADIPSERFSATIGGKRTFPQA
jgi:hypothetical protein